jgi:hypothetical protein
VEAIGEQTSAPELAVPLLLGALKDASISAKAAGALANFGTNALVAIPQLTNLVAGENESAASAALRSLILIAPQKTFPLFTNCLALGKPKISDALRALSEVMPDQALPILLLRLQSPDLGIKREAFGLLRHYPATSQIVSAMQPVALDSGSGLAPAAKSYLTEAYESNNPEASLFPDEPSYHGKRLGEWLVMRTESGDQLPAVATNAICQMGTNVFPALFKRLTYTRPAYCSDPSQINLSALWRK